MKKAALLIIGFVFLLGLSIFVIAYTGSEVASEFKEGRLIGTPFPFNENNPELQDFLSADTNSDGVVTGQEICAIQDLRCIYTQKVAYNFGSNQGNIAEIAGPTIGCYGGDNYEYYYPGGELENRGFQAKCIKDNELASGLREGSILFIRSLDDDMDSNGDGVVTGAEACQSVNEFCAYTQRIARSVEFGEAYIEVGGPIIGCYGGDSYEESQSDRLVKCVEDNDLAGVFTDGNMFTTPFPFNENNEEVEDFIEADKNEDGVTTGEEFCNYQDMTCAFTQRITWNFDFGEGFMEAAEPTIGCYGGESHEYYYPGEELENRGVAMYCLSFDEKVPEKPECGNGICEEGEGETCIVEPVECKTGEACETSGECHTICPEDCNLQEGTYAILNEKFKLHIGQFVKITDYQDMKIGFVDINEQVIAKLEITFGEEPIKYLIIKLGEKKEVFGATLSFLDYYPRDRNGIFLVVPEKDVVECPERCICNVDGTIECPVEPICLGELILCPDGVCRKKCESLEPNECKFGCLYGESCLPIGTRVEGKFCNINRNLDKQLEADSTCENNFECKSNVCISGECLSESLIRKIIQWFKNLFG